MNKYTMFFFTLVSLHTYSYACDRCDAIDKYVVEQVIDDTHHLNYAEYENSLYWYLQGRLAAWDEIKYID